MHIDAPSVSSWNSHSSSASRGSSRHTAGNVSLPLRGAREPDSVSISESARAMSQGFKRVPEIQPQAGVFSLATNNAKAVGNAGLRKYLNIGSGAGATNLTAMNFSRKKIADRIDGALRSAGIELREDEKLAISVNGKNEIVVGGIKDKAKAKRIQEALNEDKMLAKEMRDHVAAGKINENAAKQEAYQNYLMETGQSAPDDVDELFTSPALRNYVINEYLNENAGLGLSDLSLDYDEDGNMAIVGGDETLQALLADDRQLGATIGKILESGDAGADFTVSFDYANGALTDSHSQNMAQNKINGIRDILQDRLIGFSATLEKTAGDEELTALNQVLMRGFTVTVKSTGEFELVGLDHLDDMSRDTLKNLLKSSIDDWANAPANAHDGGGAREASLADVYDTFIQEHQFEHGDTAEYAHELEISFSGSGHTRVTSPEADKAQHAKNQEVATQMGEALREDMEKEGINTAGLEMEVDEKGRITVKGDLPEADLKAAQAFVDNFMKTAKAGGYSGGEEGEEDAKARHEAGEERRAMHFGAEEEDMTPGVVASATGDGKAASAAGGEEIDESAMSAKELRQHRTNQAWEKIFPKNHEGGFYLGAASGVSDIKPDRYQNTGGDDAASLYRRFLNGLGKFHDQPKSYRYAA